MKGYKDKKPRFYFLSVYLATLLIPTVPLSAFLSKPQLAKNDDQQNQNAVLSPQNTTDVSLDQKPDPVSTASFCLHEKGLGISAEFLYWSTNYNLPFSLEGSNNQENLPVSGLISSSQLNTVNAQVIRTKQNWSPGTRVTLAFFPCHENFDLKFCWTYYENHPRFKISGGNNILFGASSSTRAALQLVYNTADIELGKSYTTGAQILLRPFCGVRAGFLYQNHRVHFSGVTSVTLNGLPDSPVVNTETPLKIYLDQHVWSVGPRIGLDSKWFRWGGFSVLAKVSTALLYGKAMQKAFLDSVSSNPDSNNQTVENSESKISVQDDYFQLYPNLDLFLGLSWEHCFNKKKSVEISAGWETNYWWSTSNLLFFDRAISMQGLTVAGSINF